MHPIDKELKCMLSGDFEKAWEISQHLENLGPEKIPPNADGNNDIWMRHCFNRGWFLLQQGDYQGGCRLLENGRYLNVYGSGLLRTAAPLWNPEEHETNGKTIIISLEGGFGDEIIHVRYASHLKKKMVLKKYILLLHQNLFLYSNELKE